MPPTAVVMNMFYTGLGIARSLGEQNIPVVGLSAVKGLYGNYTRYARVLPSPDSRSQPDQLLEFLLQLGKQLNPPAVLFPTRDHDLAFLDRYRKELAPYFLPVVPAPDALRACLNKWETYQWACKTGVSTPKSWLVESEADLIRQLPDISYPCVLKPVCSHHWRQQNNWDLVGGRKAVAVEDSQQLKAEYSRIVQAEPQALIQQMIPGGDDCLVIAACYVNRRQQWVAGFNTRKLIQVPEGLGTGCIVQSVTCQQVMEPTARLLRAMGFTGIAEVEYKWDASCREYRLIEINPRPWDQLRLGKYCGVDLAYLAYCDYAGLPLPQAKATQDGHKWIAEDAFFMEALRMLWRRDRRLFSLFRHAAGKRTYGIWLAKDPLPLFMYLKNQCFPSLGQMMIDRFRRRPRLASTATKERAYGNLA